MDNLIKTAAEVYENTAMPCGRVVHSDPTTPATPEQLPLPPAVAKKPISQKSAAEWAYERVIMYLQNFEEQLDKDHEVAMGFTGGSTGVLRIEGVGYFDPDLITFYGKDATETKVQLIQHVTQLNVMLRAVSKQTPDEDPPRRIGFRLAQDLGET
ncbi:MAG: hypothetical protein ACJASV_000295 [Pseudorhodobacter sp.]|jgi:hypothetical protein